MPKIHVLDKQVAELIAAGEVVERPASAVKELIENAIDAGATAVTVEIKNGGVSFIRVTDDGCGIAREDVPAAFLRHATSKIRTEEDLEAIGTLGFRGEALCSIAAVSRCEMLTRTANELAGTHAALEGGELLLVEDAGCPQGTTILIRDLFFNTPARMKFLKKDVSEGNAVGSVVERAALSHPEVSVLFLREGREELHTPGDGKLLSAVFACFGRAFAEAMIPVEYEQEGIKTQGYVSAPTAARSNRSLQLFFLNGRCIRSKTAAAALEEAFRTRVMVGRYPACVLNLELDPSRVDVNVHPAKLEVRFANEKQVFDAVYYGVKNALGEGEVPPSLKLPDTSSTHTASPRAALDSVLNVGLQKAAEEQGTKVFSSSLFNPVRLAYEPVQNPARAEAAAAPPVRISLEDTESSAAESAQEAGSEPASLLPDGPSVQPAVPVSPGATFHVSAPGPIGQGGTAPVFCRAFGECFHTYILVESGGMLWVIDKHAAHERILYEQIKAKGEASAQVLLSPVTVVLSREEYDAVLSHPDELRRAGFGVEDFGGSSVLLREAPMLVPAGRAAETLQQVAWELAQNKKDTTPEVVERLYHSVACRAAVKAGDRSKPEELAAIAREVLSRDDLRHCPHGRPVAFTLSVGDLEKQFGRT